jgi:hypothetical protein
MCRKVFLQTSALETLFNTPYILDQRFVMWSGKTGLEKSQIKPEITHPYETRTKKVHQ